MTSNKEYTATIKLLHNIILQQQNFIQMILNNQTNNGSHIISIMSQLAKQKQEK